MTSTEHPASLTAASKERRGGRGFVPHNSGVVRTCGDRIEQRGVLSSAKPGVNSLLLPAIEEQRIADSDHANNIYPTSQFAHVFAETPNAVGARNGNAFWLQTRPTWPSAPPNTSMTSSKKLVLAAMRANWANVEPEKPASLARRPLESLVRR